MVMPPDSADRALLRRAIFVGSEVAKSVRQCASREYSGAPGGWPICRPADVVMNSPQSQKLTVGSIVAR